MRRRTVIAAAAAMGLVVGGGTGATVALDRSHGEHHGPGESHERTVTVVRGTLEQAQTLPGQLGYGVPLAIAGHGTGTVTWLPSSGAVVGRGHQLYRVDDRPVVLLYGALPLYRTLTDHPQPPAGTGDGDDGDSGGGAGDAPSSPPSSHPPAALLRGADVDLIAANLAALGRYHGPTSGATYGWSLAQAVEQWQESLGEEPTGVIQPGDVVVAPGQVRVDGVTAHLGDDAQEPVLTITSTAKVITLQAPEDLAASLEVDHRIRVTLPDGHAVATRVQTIGTATGGADGGPPSTPVVVRPVHASALRTVELGPVTARVVTASIADALQVPVAALLAVSGGGYAVERTDHTLVPVTIGMVAGGAVQVSGVAAGTAVVVAR